MRHEARTALLGAAATVHLHLAVGHELNCGEKLYSDVFDTKPPGVFATYALAERVTGYNQVQIYLLSVVAAIVTLLGVYPAHPFRETFKEEKD